jgi:hypothetical protein
MAPAYRLPAGFPVSLIVLCLLLAVTGTVSAHAPAGAGNNDDLLNATLISSPEKSYVLYTEIPGGGEAQYYRFPMEKGQVLSGSLMVPGPDSMVPDLAVIGPGITPSGDVPPSLTVPPGSAALVIRGQVPEQPSYEPFTPQPVYTVARFSVTVPEDGSYYIAVFGETGGRYSLAPGFREEFTAAEWLLIPWSVIGIHLWQGQEPILVFAPLIAVLAGGFALILAWQMRRGMHLCPLCMAAVAAGLLYIGGAAMTALQLVLAVSVTGYEPSVLLTLLFIGIPLVLGLVTVQAGLGLYGQGSPRKNGVILVLAGLLGLLFWAGLVIGPVIAIVTGGFALVGTGSPRSPAR